MAFHNKKKDFLKQTIFSNIHEGTTNPVKKWYAYITFDGKEAPIFYDGKFRVEAVSYFEEFARINGGRYNGKIYAL
jgi:hypothetical protein